MLPKSLFFLNSGSECLKIGGGWGFAADPWTGRDHQEKYVEKTVRNGGEGYMFLAFGLKSH